MSVQATERQPAGRGAGGGNPLTRRYGGVPGWGWAVIVSLVAGGVIWYVQRRKASSSAAAAPAGPTQATCYDANGVTVACSDPSAVGSNATDYFEALYAQQEGINNQLQNIDQLSAETGIDVDTLERLLKELQGDESDRDNTHPGGGGPGPVQDLTVRDVTRTSVRLSWRPGRPGRVPPGAGTSALQTYTVRVEGKDRAAHNIGARTSYVVGGLRPGGHYTAVVAPAGGPPASKAFTLPVGNPGGPNVPPPNPGGLNVPPPAPPPPPGYRQPPPSRRR